MPVKNRQVSNLDLGTAVGTVNGIFSTQSMDFYSSKANEKIGMIVTKSQSEDLQFDVKKADSDAGHYLSGYITRLKKMVDRVHQFGTKVFAELNSESNNFLPSFLPVKRVKNPIINRHWDDDVIVMNSEIEKEKVIDDYVKLATIAKMVGFDGAQVDISTGNATSDKYMMDYHPTNTNATKALNERFEFAERVIDAIKVVCGDDFPVILNVNVDDEFLTLAGKQDVAQNILQNSTDNGNFIHGLQKLEEVGYDAFNLNITSTNFSKVSDNTYLLKRNLVLVNKIKDAVDIPVILQLQKEHSNLGAKALNKGIVDAIGLEERVLSEHNNQNRENVNYSNVQSGYWAA